MDASSERYISTRHITVDHPFPLFDIVNTNKNVASTYQSDSKQRNECRFRRDEEQRKGSGAPREDPGVLCPA